MEKIVPDPPHNLDFKPGKVLSQAISEGIVPMEYVLKVGFPSGSRLNHRNLL
jgi:hypothetical protein